MLAGIRSRLTYANVMATIALFVALGLGTAWALETNSVKSKHIAPDAAKGTDIKEATLEEVPSAADADTLDGKDSDEFRTKASSTAWKPVTLAGTDSCTWTNFGAPFANAEYFLDGDGNVHLRGMVRANDAAVLECGDDDILDAIIGVLPTDHRPPHRVSFAVNSNDKPGRVDVLTNGRIEIGFFYPTFADAEQWVQLDGISFCTDAVNGCG